MKSVKTFWSACAVLIWGLSASALAAAQQVQDLTLDGVPPDLISPDAPASAALTGVGVQPQPTGGIPPSATPMGMSGAGAPSAQPGAPVDLGENLNSSGAAQPVDMGAAETGAAPAAAPGPAERAALAAQGKSANRLRRATPDAAGGPVERVVFERAPVRVPLPVGRERMVTLPAAAALRVPSDMEKVARIQNIDRSLYVTALTPFAPIRVVAELLDTGQRIPMDFVADKTTAASTGELQVSVIDPRGGGGDDGSAASGQAAAAGPAGSGTQTSGLDMVELTRYAARQLYAPARLANRLPGVTQIAVEPVPQPTLIRGVDAQIMPLGQWKSGPLYVTALRVTNRSRYPLEIPLEQLRGNWIAATAQHGRIGPAGSDTDTTAIYLVCARPFAACL